MQVTRNSTMDKRSSSISLDSGLLHSTWAGMVDTAWAGMVDSGWAGAVVALLVVALVGGEVWAARAAGRRPGRLFPPGPPSLPLVGSLPFVTLRFPDPLVHVRLTELSKRWVWSFSRRVLQSDIPWTIQQLASGVYELDTTSAECFARRTAHALRQRTSQRSFRVRTCATYVPQRVRV